MNKVIVAFESEARCRQIRSILESGGITVREHHNAGSKIIRAIRMMGGGIVVSGDKLSDMTAEDLAIDLGESAIVLVAARPPQMPYADIPNLHKLPAPFTGNDLLSAVRMLIDLEELQPRWTHQQRSSDGEQSVRDAKETLMAKNDMTEEQAHRFIQRNCMEKGLKMEEVARMILEAYDTKD